LQKIVNLEIERTYVEFEAHLLKEKGRIVAKEPPTSICFEQGSIWGMTPRTAKKWMSYNFFSQDSETRVVASTSLGSDWKNLGIIGCVFSVLLATICWWISVDLKALSVAHSASVWSWIVTVNGYIDFQIAQVLISLTQALAVFLIIVTVLEAAVLLYVCFGKDSFAEDTLDSFMQNFDAGK